MSDPRLALGADHAGVGAARVLEALDGTRVIVRLAPGLAEPAGAAGLALVSIVGRLLPHVVVDGDAPVGPNPWAATSVTDGYDRLAATRPAPTRPATRDLLVAVGPRIDRADLWVGGEEWTARLGRIPQPLDPAGAGAGAAGGGHARRRRGGQAGAGPARHGPGAAPGRAGLEPP